MNAVVENEQAVRDCTLPSGIRRSVQEVSFEGHRRRAAGIEGAGGDSAEPDHRLRELEVRHSGAVARSAPVDGDQDDAAVRLLSDSGTRVTERELAAREVLERPEDRLAVSDDERAAADGVDY